VSISPTDGGGAWQPVSNGDRQIAVMKKAQDVREVQAEALVELVKQAAPMPEHVGTQLNVVA
jgi:hypothetical protein